MKSFESKPTEIQSSGEEIYSFLSDFNNFGKLMPPEISNWKSTTYECSFTISGMADLSMSFGECTPNQLITMKADGKNPFDYFLEIHLEKIEERLTHTVLVFHADLNPMLVMVASNPLKNFVNLLVETLKHKMES